MNYDQLPAKVTLWANRFIAAVMLALLFLLPTIMDWYSTIRPLSHAAKLALLIAFYCCAVFVMAALWGLDRLLRNILNAQVFIRDNVRCIRLVRLCCAAVCLICIPAAFFYLPLVFFVLIMGFLCLVVGVVCQVMKAAVTIREENDLTI